MFDYVFEISFEVHSQDVATWKNVITTHGWLGYVFVFEYVPTTYNTMWHKIIIILWSLNYHI
jgi:hypothetical protein